MIQMGAPVFLVEDSVLSPLCPAVHPIKGAEAAKAAGFVTH
ncbi:hypothetical protein [Tritonibacter multivorans]|nr:hypothetical protein [Tritonibacter multivorans]